MAVTSLAASNFVGSLELIRMFTTGGSVCAEPLGTSTAKERTKSVKMEMVCEQLRFV